MPCVAFVLDRSGSMAGWKIVATRRTLARMVDMLRPEDRFTVLAFNDVVEAPPGGGTSPVPATERHRGRAVDFLCGLPARGGWSCIQRRHTDSKIASPSPGPPEACRLSTDP